jgi:hypothetical protein
MKKCLILPLIIISVLVPGCEGDTDKVNDTDCASTLCTMEFRSVMVVLKHKSDSTLFKLTDYKVNRVSDNLDVTPAHADLSGYSGYYSVANDSKKDLYKFKNVEVVFTGYVNNSIIMQKRFTITADCCHISLVEGNNEFYL